MNASHLGTEPEPGPVARAARLLLALYGHTTPALALEQARKVEALSASDFAQAVTMTVKAEVDRLRSDPPPVRLSVKSQLRIRLKAASARSR